MKDKKMDRICPVCSSSEKVFIYNQKLNNTSISLMDNYDVVSCENCDFIFADKIPDQSAFNHYYKTMSKYEFDYKKGNVANDYMVHFKKIFKFIKPYVSDKATNILDIGCSTGALLAIFKNQGYHNVQGLDPSKACAETANKLYNIEVVANNILDYRTDQKFDLIILSAVLEHLIDLNAALKKMNSLLKDNGLLFIEVPDVNRFHSYIFTPFQQFSFEHINYFSDQSLLNLLSKFGFENLKMMPCENRVNQTIDPDIFAIFSKSNPSDSEFKKDPNSLLNVNKYISKCHEIDLELNNLLNTKLKGRNKIIVWGVGTHTQRLLGSGLDTSIIEFFVDSNTRYAGKRIDGVEIKSPEAILDDNIPILISTFSFQNEIHDQIREELKITNEIIHLY